MEGGQSNTSLLSARKVTNPLSTERALRWRNKSFKEVLSASHCAERQPEFDLSVLLAEVKQRELSQNTREIEVIDSCAGFRVR